MAITRAQKAMLHVAIGQLGLDDDGYRAALRRAAGAKSSCELDNVTFDWVLVELERLGWQRPAGSRSFGGVRAGFATNAQVHTIRTMWDTFTNGQGTEKSLDHWLERQFKVSSMRFLTELKARKVIAALRAMNERRHPQAA